MPGRFCRMLFIILSCVERHDAAFSTKLGNCPISNSTGTIIVVVNYVKMTCELHEIKNVYELFIRKKKNRIASITWSSGTVRSVVVKTPIAPMSEFRNDVAQATKLPITRVSRIDVTSATN